ncbi:MAG: alpha-galactosidase [Candidatus Bathyarchaeota archaeon]|nr:alpha-galactosidase [Candidatus Bathyarchaeota archaeon]
MIKITYLGAGSAFAPVLSKDIFQIPGLEEGTFSLVDIDPKRLKLSHEATKIVNEKLKSDWKIVATTDRREVMTDSDFIINTIEVSGLDTVQYDYEIPLKYGVDQCIGDTGGPGGIMKALRTVPPWLEILKDAQELCPDAVVLNYTNPMSIMMLATFRASKMKAVGLCHSVQGTSGSLAGYLDVPYNELKWQCAGINHMSWFTELTRQGEDMYPLLKRKAKEDKELYERDPVKFEILFHLGYFVTESSGHFSEYVPYFRKRPELITKYCREGYLGGRGFYAKNWPRWRQNLDEKRQRIIDGKEEPDLTKSVEYACQIIEGMMFDRCQVIHGNVRNDSLITNLPQNEVVEVACLIDRNGVHPTHFGELPPQLAALNRSNMAVYDMTVRAIVNNSYEMAEQALMLDPLTAAVCSLEEIREMFAELYEAEKDYIPELRWS